MKTFFTFILFILYSTVFAQEAKKFDLIDVIILDSDSYKFKINSDGKTFLLQACLNKDCKTEYEYLKSMNANAFLQSVIIQINTEHSKNLDLVSVGANDGDKNIKALLDKVKLYDEQKIREGLSEENRLFRDVQNAKNRFAGILTLNVDKNIPYERTKVTIDSQSQQSQLLNAINAEKTILSNKDLTSLNNLTRSEQKYVDLKLTMGVTRFQNDSLIKTLFKDPKSIYYYSSIKNNKFGLTDDAEFESQVERGRGELKLQSATVHFFNNKASVIIVNAELIEDDETHALTFLNSSFSVPMRYFNNYGSKVSTFLEDVDNNNNRVKISVDYNDLFDYKQYKDTYSYAIANTQVELVNDENQKPSVKIVQRRFFDYFTAIVYSDLMGFNTEAPNPLVNAQARLLVPLNLRNWSKWTMGRQITTITNIALQNSFDDENRFINISNSDKFNNFDLLRKNNLFGKFNLEVITHEAKGWYTNIGVGYGVGFYRTGFRHTLTEGNQADVVITKQLFSIAHGPYLNFEIRPQTNFGADISLSIEDLNYAGDKQVGNLIIDDLIKDKGKDHFVMPYNLINLEANFYWLTNPEKSVGGLYAKLGGYFHTDTNTIFPQFMVGYATNLTSFVDKFRGSNLNEEK